jgi:hypothetical protein
LRNKLSEILTNESHQQNIKKGVLNEEIAMAIYLFSKLNQVDTVKQSLADLSLNLESSDLTLVIERVAGILSTDTTQSKDITGPATSMIGGVDTSQTSSSSIDKKKFVDSNKTFLRKTLTEAISERENSNEIIDDIIKQIDFDSFTILEIYNESNSNKFISDIKKLVLDEITSKPNEASESDQDRDQDQIDIIKGITRKINEILEKVEKID